MEFYTSYNKKVNNPLLVDKLATSNHYYLIAREYKVENASKVIVWIPLTLNLSVPNAKRSSPELISFKT